MRFPIIIEPTSTGFSGYSPNVPGCGATGLTFEETKQNLTAAIVFHMEGLQALGEPLPVPTIQADYIEIHLAA